VAAPTRTHPSREDALPFLEGVANDRDAKGEITLLFFLGLIVIFVIFLVFGSDIRRRERLVHHDAIPW
jgi:hypothetical protein